MEGSRFDILATYFGVKRGDKVDLLLFSPLTKENNNKHKDYPQISSIELDILNLSFIKDIELLSLSKYLLKFRAPNNLYTKPDSINITPPTNKEGIVIE